jgi:lipopolysaccharide/colanic/teichoic acid biosynthesis glycosyltransferase
MNVSSPDATSLPGGRAPRLLYAVTASMSAGYFRGRLAHLMQKGFDVHLASSPGSIPEVTGQREGVTIHALRMRRSIAPLADIVSLVRVWILLRHLKPDIVDAGTPKAGLLFSAAAALSGVPCRVYTLYGLRLETTSGFLRWLLTQMERAACACAHRVICVSPSLRQRATELRLARPDKFVVIGSGSVKGVSAERFAPTPAVRQQAERLRLELGIAAGAPVVGFVGRLTRDKGIVELVDAYTLLKPRFPSLHFLLVGPFEEGDPVDVRTRQLIEATPRILAVGLVDDVIPYYHVMDVLALPTHREGFPAVAIEAAATGRPVVTTDATGAVDSVVDGDTGFIVPVGDPEALAGALGRVLENPELARRMGEAGRQRAIADFRSEVIWQGYEELYRELLSARTGRAGYPVKRALDVVLSLVGLTFLLLPMAITSLVILVSSGRPILFRQRRPGMHGNPFTLLKFRTMRQGPGTNDERLTRLGRFLRRFSIDELPELWNVLKGDMSLVGPRPLLMDYLELYTPEQARRHEVKPGITGWAQVNGRNAITWEQKFALDVWYVDHQSLWLDVRILALTAWKVLKREGISPPGSVTMERFSGSQGVTWLPTKERR